MLDKLKPLARHIVIAALPLVAGAILSVIPGLQRSYGADATIGLFLTLATLILTPLSRQYGVGKRGLSLSR